LSLNYPDRDKWLAVRATSLKNRIRERMVHTSTNLRNVSGTDPDTGLTVRKTVMFGKGNTYVRPPERA
jgi:hypothetical protein